MVLQIIIALVVVIGLVLLYASTRPGTFRYERSGFISAPPEKIYPHISQMKLSEQWSPYQKMDPQMKTEYGGPDAQPGASQIFNSAKAGSGRLEITAVKPNERVELSLHMMKPFEARNHVIYSLKPEGSGTRFTWVMEGETPFISKLIGIFVNFDKMIGGQFEDGINNLKTLTEKP